MKPLTKELIYALRRQAHGLKPEVAVGKDGFTEETVRSIREALHTKELVKVKLLQNSTMERGELREALEGLDDIALIQNVGKTYVLYKERDKTAEAEKKAQANARRREKRAAEREKTAVKGTHKRKVAAKKVVRKRRK